MKIKKLVSAGLAASLMLGIGTAASAKITPKDFTGDGKINIADVTALVKKIAAHAESSLDDINGDGKTTIADATALLNYVVSGKT